MKPDTQEGSVGVQYLAILFFLAAATGAAALMVTSALSYQKRSEAEFKTRAALEEAALKALPLLEDDATPEADGAGDPIWDFPNDGSAGITRKVRDVSSALNANFVRKAVFEKTDLQDLMIPGKTEDELQQFREDSGLSPSVEAYKAFFTKEAMKYSVTGYGWANINVSDEFALRKLCAAATGSEAFAETLHGKVQQLLIEKKVLGREELPFFLGTRVADLFPIMNVEPAMNVNFVDPHILRELIAYPDYHLSGVTAKADSILSMRLAREIKPQDLGGLFGLDANHILFQYFGCRTWFWEISAERDDKRCVLVVAAIPELSALATTKRKFSVIERRFEP